MIVYASTRTDIPAFYSQWLMRRIEEGYVMVASPYDSNLIYRLELKREVIDAIGFCTKNPEPLIPYIYKLKEWNTLFHITITPYSKEIERGICDKRRVVEAFKNLSLKVGRERVVWRYDPVLISPSYSVSSHKAYFSTLCSLLEGFSERVIFSFLDVYPFIEKRMAQMGIRAPFKSEMEELAPFFVEEGKKHGFLVSSCAEGKWMENYGVETKGCLTKEVWNKVTNSILSYPKREGKRKECNCILGFDIGGYGGCANDCVYCYGRGGERREVHNPLSPMLFGVPRQEAKIVDVKAESWKTKDGWLF